MKRKRIGVNTVYNILGVVAPMAVSIFSIPWYLHVIGEARFGILSLVWIVFGYFGLFDFGLSRATTNRLAQLRDGDPRERNAVFYTALASNSALGIVAGVLFYLTASVPLYRSLVGHSALTNEVSAALPWLASFFPLSLIGGVFVGALEAEERFLTLNLQQIIGAILQQTLPLAACLMFAPNVEYAVLGALAARTFSVTWNATAAMSTMRRTGRPAPRVDLVWSLLKYGTNIVVSNIVSPILVSADQFLIASLLGAKAVAYYAVPFNLTMKALIVPSALNRALFPRLSSMNEDEAASLSRRASSVLAGLLALICVPSIVLAGPALNIWLGPAFAKASVPVMQLLFVGTWINGIALIPGGQLYASGKPGIVARFHVIELLPFIAILWFSLHAFGLVGAAFAWCMRVTMDTTLLYWAAGTKLRDAAALLPPGLFVIAAWIVTTLLNPDFVQAAAIAILSEGAFATWFLATNADVQVQFTSITARLRRSVVHIMQ